MKQWRAYLTAGVLALFALALASRRAELAVAIHQIAALSPIRATVIMALVVARIFSGGAFTAAVTPGLSVVRGAAVQQASAAANNTIVGSGPLSTGVRIAMMRSWKFADSTIALTIMVLNVVAGYIVWTIGLLAAIVGAMQPDDGVIDHSIFIAGIAATSGVLVASTGLWWALLHRPRFAKWFGRLMQRLWDASRRRFPRLPEANIDVLVERSQVALQNLITCRGRLIVLSVVVDQVLMVAIPIAIVRSFGIGEATVSTMQLLIAYGGVKLVAALTPMPGGVGVTEFGLATLLTRYGGPESTVLAAVLVYRVLTFVLPVITGGVCFAIWRWRHRGGTPVALQTLHVDDGAEFSSELVAG